MNIFYESESNEHYTNSNIDFTIYFPKTIFNLL